MKKNFAVLFSNEDNTFKIFDKPVHIFSYKSGILTIDRKSFKTSKPLQFLEKIVKREKLFAVGFISFDYKRYTLNVISLKKDEFNLPEIFFLLFKDFKVLDTLPFFNFKTNIKSTTYPEKEEFINAVEKALNYIEAGDIYQVNLSSRIEIEGSFNKERIFYNLTKVQPTPYMLLLKATDFSVISASMELFLEKKGDTIITKPIKGTRPRGSTVSQDEKLFFELKNSEKERAENLMITDLMRNDLGRVAKPGTVEVKELFKVEKYETLYQMHSTVCATLKDGISFQQIVNETFPPGSVSGAPKKRAVEIIDELEKYRRYIYCGAHFFITPDFDFVSSVAIRQSIFIKDKCYIYVGAGIVSDSIPEKEYEEILLKAKANLKSIQL